MEESVNLEEGMQISSFDASLHPSSLSGRPPPRSAPKRLGEQPELTETPLRPITTTSLGPEEKRVISAESSRVRIKCFFGGEVRVLSIDPHESFVNLNSRLRTMYGFNVIIKYNNKGDMCIVRSQRDLEVMLLNFSDNKRYPDKIEVTIVDEADELSNPLAPKSLLRADSINQRDTNRNVPRLQPIESVSDLVPEPRGPFQWQRGEIIGQGAYGTVYLGLNLDHGELMAVKQFDTRDMGCSPSELVMLENEIQLLRNLDHPNIVRYLGTERVGQRLSIFLEYVSGGSIRQLLDKFGLLSESVIRNYTRQIMQGLEYLHRRDIAHRDIKSANILVCTDGTVKLADFGASKKISGTVSIGTTKGTPLWMAPEVIKQQQTSKGWRKADIWALGCTVVEMATGHPPWNEFSNPVTAMYQIACTDKIPDIPDCLSENGRAFLHLCFQRDPNIRPDVSGLLMHPFVAATSSRDPKTPARPKTADGRRPVSVANRGLQPFADSPSRRDMVSSRESNGPQPREETRELRTRSTSIESNTEENVSQIHEKHNGEKKDSDQALSEKRLVVGSSSLLDADAEEKNSLENANQGGSRSGSRSGSREKSREKSRDVKQSGSKSGRKNDNKERPQLAHKKSGTLTHEIAPIKKRHNKRPVVFNFDKWGPSQSSARSPNPESKSHTIRYETTNLESGADSKRIDPTKKNEDSNHFGISNALVFKEDGTNLWLAFGPKDAVPWEEFWLSMEEYIMRLLPGRVLTENDELYIKMKVFGVQDSHACIVTLDLFAHFWEWFFNVIRTLVAIKPIWECVRPVCVHGFVTHTDAQKYLCDQEPGTFLIRLSEERPGWLSVIFVDAPLKRGNQDQTESSKRNTDVSLDTRVSAFHIQVCSDGLYIYFAQGQSIKYQSLSELVQSCKKLTALYPGIPKQQAFSKY